MSSTEYAFWRRSIAANYLRRVAISLIAIAVLFIGAVIGLVGLQVRSSRSSASDNVQLQAGENNPERRTIGPPGPYRPAILMAFSGSGSRAAALAEAVLREMAATSYLATDGRHVLTDDVKLISSVSGGSLTAAWFGLRRSSAHPDGDLDGLRDGFLAQNNMPSLRIIGGDLITWLGHLTGSNFKDLLDTRLFHGARFADINQPYKPVIALNATDVASGDVFTFSPRRFDDICSTFDVLPASTAVAASAAFPVLRTPVGFRNFSDGCTGRLRNGEWIKVDLSNPYTPYLNLPEYRDARYSNDMRRGPNPFRSIRYLYFMNGSSADGLGIQSLRSAILAPYDDGSVLRAINEGGIRRLAIILVSAGSDQLSAIDDLPTIGAFDYGLVSSVSSANPQVVLSGLLSELAMATANTTSSAKFAGIDLYGITIDLDQIPADTAAHRELRDKTKTAPTAWTLTGPDLQAIETAGRLLLRRDPCYRALVADLHASQSATAAAEPLAIRCTTKIDMEKRSVAPRTAN